jgi:hypothetical protein
MKPMNPGSAGSLGFVSVGFSLIATLLAGTALIIAMRRPPSEHGGTTLQAESFDVVFDGKRQASFGRSNSMGSQAGLVFFGSTGQDEIELMMWPTVPEIALRGKDGKVRISVRVGPEDLAEVVLHDKLGTPACAISAKDWARLEAHTDVGEWKAGR